MKLKELGEFGFIDRIKPKQLWKPGHVFRGIGDDCAVVRTEDAGLLLITTDILIEGIHFILDTIGPRCLGRKSLSVNLSDIAAMGGEPYDAYIAIAVPGKLEIEFLDEFYAGLYERAGEFGVNLLGGDTTSSLRDFMIAITLTGAIEESEILCRNTALPGDHIYLTGPVGDSRAGLHILLNGNKSDRESWESLVRTHLDPYPHVNQGRWIAQSGYAHAMIDVSDGISSDLGHICDESAVGCLIDVEAIPLSDELLEYCDAKAVNPADFALAGGEDYVLLCTGEPELKEVADRAGVKLFDIGVIRPSPERFARQKDGSLIPFQSRGWDHFSISH